ncbi:MAG: MarR family transcriptional regulator [Clostridiales bacterium]|nr:MarR family transcriptional regulator [Clostridiales bacterium]
MRNNGRSCAALFKQIDVKMTRRANEQFDAYGVTFMQVQMLRFLREMDADSAAIPLKTLERHFKVAQSTAAGIIVRLEKKGMVKGVTPADDRRQKFIGLTEKGKALCVSIEEDMLEGERVLLSNLKEEETEQLYRLLKKVNEAIE